MEQLVEKAKDLVGGYKNVGISVSDADASFIEEYAFYADDFERVELLAKELIDGKQGVAAGGFIEKVRREIVEKKVVLQRFLDITWQGEELLQRGNAMLNDLKAFFGKEGISMEQKYYIDQETKKQKAVIREDFEKLGREGLANVRIR